MKHVFELCFAIKGLQVKQTNNKVATSNSTPRCHYVRIYSIIKLKFEYDECCKRRPMQTNNLNSFILDVIISNKIVQWKLCAGHTHTFFKPHLQTVCDTSLLFICYLFFQVLSAVFTSSGPNLPTLKEVFILISINLLRLTL